MLKRIMLLIGIFSLCTISNADTFSANTKYQVCFTPYQRCTNKIVSAINNSKHSINMQVYSFTSRKIAYALRDAVKRGVKVDVIYDASNFNPDYFSFAKMLTNSGAECGVDDSVRIAHNKVMIIDNDLVITGSFNFTYAAERKNAENVLLIYNKKLASKYNANFFRRKNLSEKCIL